MSSSEDEKWASIAQIKEEEEADADDNTEEGTRGASTTAAVASTNGEDSNNSNLDLDQDQNNPITNGRIHLKAIPRSEMESLNQIRQQQRRRSRKAAFFVTDAQSTLSADQMKSQMNDIGDTLIKDHISEMLKVGKVSDKFDKLVKTPERQLTARLESHFPKSVSTKKMPTPTFNDFDINIEEIEAQVDQLAALRKRRRSNSNAKCPRSGAMKNGDDHSEDVDYSRFSFSDFKRKAVKSATTTVTTTNQSNTGTIKLGKIDANFRPTVSLGTKTYTRTRTKDPPPPPVLPQKDAVEMELKEEMDENSLTLPATTTTTTTTTESTNHN